MLAELSNKKEKILELESRKRVYEIVKKNSGCHFREIERRSKIPHGTLKYHLHFLVKHNLLIEKKENNNLRYFPRETEIKNLILLGILRQATLRKIILFVLISENCNHEDITNFIKLSSSTTSWHINKLLRAGIIASQKDGRKTKYKILTDKNEIIKLLITYKESFLDSLVNRVVEMWEIR
jgi:predicted transcriptional regulator